MKTHHFHKLPCQEPITKNGVLPVIKLFFWKFCFVFRTSSKELFWCSHDPNVHIHNIRKHWNFIWGLFFLVSITNRPTREKFQLNLKIQEANQVTFGTKRSRYLGSNIWNSLPYGMKLSENLSYFKTLIKSWNGRTCASKICQIWSYIFLKFTLVNF